MKVHTTNYYDTLIEVAEDCPAALGEIPVSKPGKSSVAEMQFDLLSRHPYQFTSDDILFKIYADRNDLIQSEHKDAREEFFSKGQPCLRASPLPKRYGYGVHSDGEGKIAIFGIETAQYSALLNDNKVTKVKAMRTSKK